MRGDAVMVPVLEGDGTARIGRFGWKNQHASLESFSADAYLNEMGITSPLFPEENTSSGRNVGFGTPYDPVADPEDDGVDVVGVRELHALDEGAVARTDHDGRAARRAAVQSGRLRRLATWPSIQTARPGTRINGGAFTVPAALGNKIIHPYSDFLVHDIGTGDGIPVLPTPEYAFTTNRMRTAPLWALRTRNRLMHDGLSFTKQEAIARHAGQAAAVTHALQRAVDRRQRTACSRSSIRSEEPERGSALLEPGLVARLPAKQH